MDSEAPVVCATRQTETAVIDGAADIFWGKIRDLKWDELWAERVASVEWLEGSAGKIGSTFQIKFKDETSWTYVLSELSDLHRLVTWELIAAEPPIHVSSQIGTIKVKRVTASDQTFIQWTTDFSSDVTAQIVADNKYKKLDFFAALSSQLGVSIECGKVVEDKGICVGENWTDAGAQDADTVAAQQNDFQMMGIAGWDIMKPGATVEGMRAFLNYGLSEERKDDSPESLQSWTIYQNYTDQCTEEHRTEVGGPEYHPNAAVIDAHVIRVKGKDANQKCVVFFHGGGVIAGRGKDFNRYCSRVAVDLDATVINVNYRLAPEHKLPCAIDDCYAAVKWTIAKADELGINPNKIITMGESGGGYLVSAVSMRLGEANEGNLIKFGCHLQPMVTNNCFVATDVDDMMKAFLGVNTDIYEALCENFEEIKAGDYTDKWIFPSLIDDELCKKCPPAVILSCEFDTCLIGANETADVYRRNNNLLVYGRQRGSHHAHHYNPLHCRTDSWHKALADICSKYL